MIDLCFDPLDRLGPHARRAACFAAEPSLSRRLRSLQPQSNASLLRSLRLNIERAASRAGWNGLLLELPYPGRWVHHRDVFLKKLVPHLLASGLAVG